MSFMESLRELFKKGAVKRIIEPIDQNRGGEAPELIIPELHYYRLRMVEMFIDRERWLGRKFFPAVQGLVKTTYNGADLELPSVADTSQLFDQQTGGDIAVRNFSLTPLMPFRGNTVEIACGLFGMRGAEDYIGQVIKVLSDFGGLLAVPQLTQVLNVAGPLASGVQDLFAADGKMHLAYHDQWVSVSDPQQPAANALTSGYIAVIRATEGEVNLRDLRIENQQLRIVKNGGTEPFTDKDHMLIHIEAREDRDDLTRLTGFDKFYTDARDALGQGAPEKAGNLMRQCMAATSTSPDLTNADRARVSEHLKRLYFEAKARIEEFGAFGDQMTAMASPDALRPTVSARDALEAGVPTLEELWEGL